MKIKFFAEITIKIAKETTEFVDDDQLAYEGQTKEEYIARHILHEMLSQYPASVDWMVDHEEILEDD